MKTLFLLRHAKSSWKDESISDYDRPLNRRGKPAAETLGSYIKTNKILPELILSSPAIRARETVDRMIKAAKLDTEVRYDERIYGAGVVRLAEVVSQIENERREVMIVGHNPGMEELLSLLTENEAQIPTAGLAKIVAKVAKWSALNGPQRATLEWLVKPKELE